MSSKQPLQQAEGHAARPRCSPPRPSTNCSSRKPSPSGPIRGSVSRASRADGRRQDAATGPRLRALRHQHGTASAPIRGQDWAAALQRQSQFPTGAPAAGRLAGRSSAAAGRSAEARGRSSDTLPCTASPRPRGFGLVFLGPTCLLPPPKGGRPNCNQATVVEDPRPTHRHLGTKLQAGAHARGLGGPPGCFQGLCASWPVACAAPLKG